MAQIGSLGKAWRAARCGASGKRHNAVEGPICTTEGQVLLCHGGVALLMRCPASHFEALLTMAQETPVK